MKKLRLGVSGLGRAFALMAPAFRDPRVELVAAADPRAEARRKFAADFKARSYSSVEELCADPQVEAVYVATPHELHAAHACLAAASGKHVLVEKPMALTLDECRAMIAAARESGVQLVVGHSHSFDLPVQRTRELIQSGKYGALRMITALDFTDFVYRPRRPEELATGAVYNQAAHHVDIVRLLAGAEVKSVRAFTGDWDPARRTQGAYSCLIGFDSGAFAQLTYSGYAHFDSDEFMGWIGEMGQKKDPSSYGTARRSLRGNELMVKKARNYGGSKFKPARASQHQHFGVVIASCEKADLRPLPGGVMIYGERAKRLERLPAPRMPRAEVIDELYAAIVKGRAPLHDGEWAMATLEVCLAILRSSKEQKEIVI